MSESESQPGPTEGTERADVPDVAQIGMETGRGVVDNSAVHVTLNSGTQEMILSQAGASSHNTMSLVTPAVVTGRTRVADCPASGVDGPSAPFHSSVNVPKLSGPEVSAGWHNAVAVADASASKAPKFQPGPHDNRDSESAPSRKLHPASAQVTTPANTTLGSHFGEDDSQGNTPITAMSSAAASSTTISASASVPVSLPPISALSNSVDPQPMSPGSTTASASHMSVTNASASNTRDAPTLPENANLLVTSPSNPNKLPGLSSNADVLGKEIARPTVGEGDSAEDKANAALPQFSGGGLTGASPRGGTEASTEAMARNQSLSPPASAPTVTLPSITSTVGQPHPPARTSAGFEEQPGIATPQPTESTVPLTQQHLQQHLAASNAGTNDEDRVPVYDNNAKLPVKTQASPSHVVQATQAASQVQQKLHPTYATRELGQHDADSYIDQVKQHFQAEPMKYTKFLEIMKELPRNRDSLDPTNNVNSVVQRVHELFSGQHPALIDGFNRFLPQGSLAVDAGTRSAPEHVSMAAGTKSQAQNQYGITHTDQASQSRLVTGGSMVNGSSALLPGGDASKSSVLSSSSTVESSMRDGMHQRNISAAPGGHRMEQNVQTLHLTSSFHPQQAHAMPIQQRSAVASHAGEVTNPPGGGSAGEPDAAKNPGELRHALGFITKIKERFENEMDTYKEFLQILHHYRLKKLTIKDVYENVMKLFNGHADLLEEFRHFLPDPKPPAHEAERYQQHIQKARAAQSVTAKADMKGDLSQGSDVGRASKSKSGGKDSSKFTSYSVEGTSGNDLFSRTKRRLKAGPAWVSLMKCIHLFNIEVISRLDLITLLDDLLSRHLDLVQEFRTALAVDEPSWESDEDDEIDVSDRGGGRHLLGNDESKTGEYVTSISNMDFSECERCGPSYRALPANFTLPECSGRTEVCTQVLNDFWVSVSQGNETDTSFKNSRKNQYEDVLFRIEDDRFEMDMGIYAVTSCIQYLEPVKNQIDGLNTEQRVSFRISDIPALHSRTIRRVYGPEKGDEILHFMQENSAAAVKVVLERLRAVDHQLRNSRRDRQDVWRTLCNDNYGKSLDHRSFYFKQGDRRFVSVKGILQEMKETVENAEGSGGEASIVTDMSDPSIHSDMARLILPNAHKFLNATDSARLQVFWKHYISSFFDVNLAFAEENSVDQEDVEDEDMDMLGGDYDDGANRELESNDGHGGKSNDKIDNSKSKGRVLADDDGDDLDDPVPYVDGKQRIIYGSNVFYIFFRLYAIMYSRLQHARQLADKKAASNVAKGVTARKRGMSIDYIPPLPPVFVDGEEKTAVGNRETSVLDEVESDGDEQHDIGVYERVLLAVERCLSRIGDGNHSPSSYEDECRELLGSGAYRLFTIERIIQQLLKQFPCLRSHESFPVMIGNFNAYVGDEAMTVEAYRNLCVEHAKDDNFYGIEFDPNLRRLSMRWLDPFGDESFARPNETEDYANWLSTTDPRFDYKDIKNVFLIRNARRNVARQRSQDVMMHNGLTCKVGHRTFKLAFVKNTTDFFIRRKRRKILSSTLHQQQTTTVVAN